MRTLTIPELNQEAMAACRLRIDNLTKPLYSLARLETMAERLAGIYETAEVKSVKKGIVIFAADHAVDGRQNKTGGRESLAVLQRLNDRRSATDAVARDLEAEVYLVNVGLEQNTAEMEQVETERVMAGAHFFGQREAMTEKEMEEALEIGFHLAERLSAQGIQAAGLGNVGERALLSALAVTAAITGYPLPELIAPNECSLTDEEKISRLGQTLAHYGLTKEKPLDILRCVGAPDIAALTGFILGAAEKHMAVIFDNAVTGAAVLLAEAIAPAVTNFVFPSAGYTEPVHKGQMKYLDMKPCLFYDITIDEGLGSALGLSIINASLHMLNDMKTFGDAAVAVAEDGPGNEKQNAVVRYNQD